MKPLYLSIISIGGLCNRMRAMAGVANLARRNNANVVFLWVEMPDMNASFNSLFQNFPYRVITIKCRRSLFRVVSFIKNHWIGTVIDDQVVYSKMKGKDRGKDFLNTVKNSNLFIWTCDNITDSEDFSFFAPSCEVKSLINNRINKDTVGVHIRRTDNEMSRKYSPTELFIRKMENEVETNPLTNFYLATDDEAEESLIKDKFGSRIICYKKRSLDRNNPEGIVDAMVDLTNLSRCRAIFGSYYSSFSDVAAMWGKINKIVVRNNE